MLREIVGLNNGSLAAPLAADAGERIRRERGAESELIRANRTLRMLSRCVQAVARADEEEPLLGEVCRLIVEEGEFRFAWVGYAEDDADRTVRPVAHYGSEAGYLSELALTWSDDDPRPSPAGLAIRGNRPVAIRSIATEAVFAPWREAALARGFRSVVALPLRHDGPTFGALSVYGDDAEAFGANEVDLLRQLADDLAYGMAALRARAERRRATEALHLSEERFRSAVENILDGFVLLAPLRDDDGRVSDFRVDYVNRAAPGPSSGSSAESLIGRRLLEMRPEHRDSALFQAYRRVVETGEPVSIEALPVNDWVDGRWTPRLYEFRARPCRGGVCAAWRDVTEHVRAEEAVRETNAHLEQRVLDRTEKLWAVNRDLRAQIAERLRIERALREQESIIRSFYNSVPLMMGIVQPVEDDLILISVNAATGRFFRVDPEILRNRRWSELEIPTPILRLWLDRCRESERSGGPVSFEYPRSAGPDGRWLRVTVSPIGSDDGPRLLCYVAEDVTDRKATEEVIGRLNQQLTQRTAELAAANAELEAFNYSVSHDLKAPLRALDGFSHALFEDYGDRLDGTAVDYLNRIRAASRRMGQLIEDLLKLSRLSQSRLSRERVDLSALVNEVGAQLAAAAPHRTVDLEVEPGLTVWGDPRLLRVAIENLLGNAWKYTGKRTDARVRFGAEGSGVAREYYVTDNGAGFDMAYAGKLFAPFQRLHPAREFEGNGIGLATVQRIVRRHGGRIRAESAPGAGATFRFTLGEEGEDDGETPVAG